MGKFILFCLLVGILKGLMDNRPVVDGKDRGAYFYIEDL